MSKLADALNFTETSRRQPIMRRMSARVESEDSVVQLGTVWRLDARFGAQVLISDALKETANIEYLRKVWENRSSISKKGWRSRNIV